MLGESYIDPTQPWLGTMETTTSSSTPWWQGIADVVSKVVGVAQKVAPAVKSLSTQVSQLRANQTSSTSYYPSYTAGTNSPVIPQPTQTNNTGTILLIVGGIAVAAGVTYAIVKSRKKKKAK